MQHLIDTAKEVIAQSPGGTFVPFSYSSWVRRPTVAVLAFEFESRAPWNDGEAKLVLQAHELIEWADFLGELSKLVKLELLEQEKQNSAPHAVPNTPPYIRQAGSTITPAKK